MKTEHYSPDIGYHVTTENKYKKYVETGAILGPVRFWPNLETAERWRKRTGRHFIVEIKLDSVSYKLPDHKPAWYTPCDVKEFRRI